VAQDEPQVSFWGMLVQVILGNNAKINEAVEKGTRKGARTGEQLKVV
jgi:hypothetical protein